MLPYSLETYFAAIARLNADQTLFVVLGVVLALALTLLTLIPQLADHKDAATVVRRIGLALGAGWIGSGTVFYGVYLEPFFFAAPWLQWGFVAQGLLLVAIIVTRPTPAPSPIGPLVHSGRALMIYALLALPLIDLLFGPGWPALRLVGLAPEPTLLFTSGWLLTRRPGIPIALLAIGPAVAGLFVGWSAVALDWGVDWIITAAGLLCLGAQATPLLRVKRGADH